MQAIKEILGRSDERKNLWNVISTMSVVVVMIVSIFGSPVSNGCLEPGPTSTGR